MSTRNISLGGVFIQGHPRDYPEIQIGSEADLVLFDADEPGNGDIKLRARVVRIEQRERSQGFSLEFCQLDGRSLTALHRLVKGKRPASP